MSFVFKCPHCGQGIQGEDAWIGQKAACPGCYREVVIQRPEASAPRVLQPAAPAPEAEYVRPAELREAGTDGAPQPQPAPFNSHMTLAVVSTVCCCVPLGIVAIIQASQANSFYHAGNLEAATACAEKARSWAIWSMVLGLVIGLLSGVAQMVAASSGGM
ncbi:MAG: CD225/dispanin family protein [Oligosphaeraceae bacterium]